MVQHKKKLFLCVIYCHSKVFMVQATRLCNLICGLGNTCGLFRGTWESVCLCVCVYIYIYIYIYIYYGDLMITYIYLWLVLLFDASQCPSSPSPFGAGSYLDARLGERWRGGVRIRRGRYPSGHGHLCFSLDKTFVLFWGAYHAVSTVPYPV